MKYKYIASAVLTVVIWLFLITNIINIFLGLRYVNKTDYPVVYKNSNLIYYNLDKLDYLANQRKYDISLHLITDNIFEYGTFSYYVHQVKYKAIANGVDYKIAVAISRLETGNYTSRFFIKYHNYGGIGGASNIHKYNSEEDGLIAFINLCKKYQNKYGDNIDAWGKHYCPPGDQWARKIKNIMLEID